VPYFPLQQPIRPPSRRPRCAESADPSWPPQAQQPQQLQHPADLATRRTALGCAIPSLYSRCMGGEGDTGSTAARREVVEKLEKIIGSLCQSVLDELQGAMNATLQTGTHVAPQLHDRLKSISEIAKILDDIDPHSINKEKIEELKKQGPTELVEDALAQGKLRERRILIEAKVAEINRKLLRWTWVAAIASVFASLGAVAAVLVAVLKP
jgi:hypothetical protein